MRVVIFCHSLISDWNHGNAHFLRGIATELIARGHDVDVFEPADAWSVQNLLKDAGEASIEEFHKVYPTLKSTRYAKGKLDIDRELIGADLVIVHEWNDHGLVKRIGDHHAAGGRYKLLFHDTHHRSATDPMSVREYDLSNYDGVLAFGEVIRQFYLKNDYTSRAWTWHEAADTRIFHPIAGAEKEGDLVWIGNWGDDERTEELDEFLFQPVKKLGLKAKIFGVRYPKEALAKLEKAGIEYGGWLPNFKVPGVFSKYRITVHVPRRPYTLQLPGIPTIRPFEALACGIPLVSAPWTDSEHLFSRGKDLLTVANGNEMTSALERVLGDEQLRQRLIGHGLETIRSRHTCSHRVDQLLAIVSEIQQSEKELGAAV